MVLAAVPWCAAASSSLVDLLLPRPQEVIEGSGAAFRFGPGDVQILVAGESEEACARLRSRWHETAARLPFAWPEGSASTTLTRGWFGGNGYGFVIARGEPVYGGKPSLARAFRGEGYELRVGTDSVEVRACSERGAFYGLMTLEQLLRLSRAGAGFSLSPMTIRDWPTIAMRGFHEDYGRNQLPTMETHRHAIETLARFKMNTYCFYIEPDHFVFSFDPEPGAGPDRFRLSELSELVRYAEQYYVDIVPVVELLGHVEGLLSDPAYAALGELTGGNTLCPTDEKTLAFAERVISELAPVFPSELFHCGLDESLLVGVGRSRPVVKADGLAKVYSDYYNHLNAIVRAYDKRMVMYSDIVQSQHGLASLLDPSIVFMFWEYVPGLDYPGLTRLSESSHEIISLAGLWDWANLYPLYPAAFHNIDTLAAQTAADHAAGFLVSSWGDGYRGVSGDNLSAWNRFGVVYGGAQGWHPGPIAIERFAPAYGLHYFGSRSVELQAALIEFARCQGAGLDWRHQARRFLHMDPGAGVSLMTRASDEEIQYWRDLKASALDAAELLSLGRTPGNDGDRQALLVAANLLSFAADHALLCRSVSDALRDGVNPAGYARDYETLNLRLQGLWQEYAVAWNERNRPGQLGVMKTLWDWTGQRMSRFAQDLASGRYLQAQRSARVETGVDGSYPFEIHGSAKWDGGAVTLAGGHVEWQDIARQVDAGYGSLVVSMAVRHDGLPLGQVSATLAAYGDGGCGWRLALSAREELIFEVRHDRVLEGMGAVVPGDGEWHHVQVAFSGGTLVAFSVDGYPMGGGQLETCLACAGPAALRLGADFDGGSPFVGELRDIVITTGGSAP